jgi:membrane-bound serine protease (ClpP class)
MNILLDPNVSYVLLVLGLIFTLLALITPGTGMPEAGAALCLLLAGYAVYKLGFNLWALVVLVLSVIPFVYAIRKPRREIFLALSILGIILGSVYLFPSQGFRPAVNPLLAVLVSILSAGFLWIAIHKALQAHHAHPRHDLSTLVGQVGEAKTSIHAEGSVQVAGELWSAFSKTPIAAGRQARVVGRDGFVLEVEPIKTPSVK